MAELDLTNIAAASIVTPASGVTAIFVDSTTAPTKRVKSKDDAGALIAYVGQDTADALSNKTIVLAAGTASLAPLDFIPGTNLTVPVAGGVEYDGAAFYATVDTTSGRAFDDKWTLFRLAANGAAISTIADFFGANSAIPTVLNGVYEMEWHCYFTVATGGTSTWTIVNTQTVTNMVADWRATPIAGLATQGAVTAAGVITQTAASVALPVTGALSAASHHHVIRAIIEASAAGNVRLRQTMSAGTSTPLRGSYLRVRRLPAGNTGSFVA